MSIRPGEVVECPRVARMGVIVPAAWWLFIKKYLFPEKHSDAHSLTQIVPKDTLFHDGLWNNTMLSKYTWEEWRPLLAP